MDGIDLGRFGEVQLDPLRQFLRLEVRDPRVTHAVDGPVPPLVDVLGTKTGKGRGRNLAAWSQSELVTFGHGMHPAVVRAVSSMTFRDPASIQMPGDVAVTGQIDEVVPILLQRRLQCEVDPAAAPGRHVCAGGRHVGRGRKVVGAIGRAQRSLDADWLAGVVLQVQGDRFEPDRA